MVRNLIHILRSFAANRWGPMWPVGMGMKQNGRSIPVYWDTTAMSRFRHRLCAGPNGVW